MSDKVAELKALKSTIVAFKKGLIQSKVADFDKHASTAEKAGLKAFVKKIQAFKKVIDAKNAKSNEKTIGKVKAVGDKLQLALAKKTDSIDKKLKDIAEKAAKKAAAKKKASKAKASSKAPSAKKSKSSKAKKSSKKSASPASFMWGGAEDEEQSELEFL